ncbi:hypothetical protein VPHK290_0039 [Vibrio phage K290]
MTLIEVNRLKNYVVDLKEFFKIADTKKAGCGDRLFSCVRQLEKATKTLICWCNSSGLFAYKQ